MSMAPQDFLFSHECPALIWGLKGSHAGCSFGLCKPLEFVSGFGGVFTVPGAIPRGTVIGAVYITRPRLNFQNRELAGCW